MCDQELRGEAEKCYSYLQTLPKAKELASLGEYDLVLDIKQDQTVFKWFYYYVSHKYQCLFWLGEYEIADMIQTAVGVQSLAHISMFIFISFITLKLNSYDNTRASP
jgi:hypothetical protein